MRRAPTAIAVSAVAVLLAAGVGLLVRAPAEAPPGAGASPRAVPSAAASAAPTETLEQQVARVARVLAEVRGLAFVTPPDLAVVEPGDLATRVIEQLDGYTDEEADLDRRLLELLGAVPPGTDLRALLVTALSEQVAGFYDPETGELVVGADDPTKRVGRIEELTLAHELEHALVDQVHGLPDLDDEGVAGEDRLLALQALIEGDATVAMQAYAEVGFSSVDRLLLAGEAAALAGELASMTELPHFLQQSLLFPYVEGAAFVTALRDHGGWEAVDAAYADPPASTLQVLDPAAYLAGVAPVDVPSSSSPADGGGWSLARSSGFGAADVLLLLQAPGGDPEAGLPDARAVATTWRGGRADLYVDGERSSLVVRVASSEPEVLRAAFEAWAAAWAPADVAIEVTSPGVVTLRLGAEAGLVPSG